jgi:hypothetical protein
MKHEMKESLKVPGDKEIYFTVESAPKEESAVMLLYNTGHGFISFPLDTLQPCSCQKS